MRYVLDTTAEKLVHALCEAVVLRRRLGLAPDRPESVILRDLLEDLARAFGAYAGLTETGGDGHPGLDRLVWDVHLCTESWQVARAFTHFPELSRFCIHPYFSMSDQRALEEWRAQRAPGAGPTGGG